jgi:AcrR family transcriptional regulator
MSDRRAQLRAEMLETLRRVGADELRRVGAAQLSLREVAERAGISPAGMYRYVDGRDELLELLIADAFDDLAAAIRHATGDDDGDDVRRIRALVDGYRSWALAEPQRFALILGSPVVGFRASDDGPTRPAARRFGDAMLRPFRDARRRAPNPAVPEREAMARIVRGWAAIHGLVILELDDQLEWTGLDLVELTCAEADSLVADLGLMGTARDQSADPVRRKGRGRTDVAVRAERTVEG